MIRASLLNSLTLKIYGEPLAAGAFGSWAGIARLIMWIMALVESLIWGYAATYLSDEIIWQGAAAVIAGVVVLVVILTLDISILTAPLHDVDIDPPQPKTVALNKGKEPNEAVKEAMVGRVKPNIATANGKFWISVILRVALAIGSIVAMSPLLNIAVFSKDITAAIEIKRTVALDATEQKFKDKLATEDALLKSTTGRFSKLITEQEELLAETERKRLNEVDGTGGSKKAGVGPIAEEQRKIADDARKKISNLSEQLRRDEATAREPFNAAKQELDRFNEARAKRQDALLRDKYGITHNANSLASRLDVYQSEIKDTSASQTIRWIIFSFQGFLLAAFLFMKLFEPFDVRIYYSQDVQNLFQLFLVGEYDGHSANHFTRQNIIFPISPSLFLNEIRKLVAEKSREDDKARARQATKDVLDQLDNNLTDVRASRVRQLVEHTKALKDLQDAKNTLETNIDTLNAINIQLSAIQNRQSEIGKEKISSIDNARLASLVLEEKELRNKEEYLTAQKFATKKEVTISQTTVDAKSRHADLLQDMITRFDALAKQQQTQ